MSSKMFSLIFLAIFRVQGNDVKRVTEKQKRDFIAHKRRERWGSGSRYARNDGARGGKEKASACSVLNDGGWCAVEAHEKERRLWPVRGLRMRVKKESSRAVSKLVRSGLRSKWLSWRRRERQEMREWMFS